jgi:hypothetical protein
MSVDGGPRESRSIGALVSSITEDLSTLVRGEIALAKAEMAQSAKNAARGAAMFAVAGVLGFLGLIFLLVALAYGLVEAGLDVWAGFLIVALLLVVIGGILVAVGAAAVKKAKGPVRAKEQSEATRRFLSTVPQRFRDATERAATDSGFTPPTGPRPTTTSTSQTTPTANRIDQDDLFR